MGIKKPLDFNDHASTDKVSSIFDLQMEVCNGLQSFQWIARREQRAWLATWPLEQIELSE
jgi:hypothetical protein